MTNEELQEKLNDVKKKLKKAHKENNEEKILYYVTLLNDLWKEASVEMLKNAEDAGMYTPNKS
mgnify:FL=1|jgi:hypothetical protein|tara:strand:+ start:51 stop:239 length:189 start_codon:yes stop_codon:yes gene_type:complete